MLNSSSRFLIVVNNPTPKCGGLQLWLVDFSPVALRKDLAHFHNSRRFLVNFLQLFSVVIRFVGLSADYEIFRSSRDVQNIKIVEYKKRFVGVEFNFTNLVQCRAA